MSEAIVNTPAPQQQQGAAPDFVNPGAIPGETLAQTQARLYKVTVDGAEMEVDEQELTKGYAHGKAAQARMQEAALKRKEAEDVLRLFRENPEEVFRRLGQDPRAFAERLINDHLNEALLTPEQKELRDYKRKVETFEGEQRSAREAHEKEQQEAQMTQMAEQIQTEVLQALDTSGLPKTSRTISRIVYYMQAALDAGFPNVKPADVISYVKDDYKSDIQQLLGGLPDDVIEAFLGQDVTRKIARSTVKSVKMPTSVPRSVNDAKAPSKDKKITSPRQFFNRD